MSLSVAANALFLATVAVAVLGRVRRIRRPPWLSIAVRLVRHRRSRRLCIRLAHRHLRRRHPAVASGLALVARVRGVAF